MGKTPEVTVRLPVAGVVMVGAFASAMVRAADIGIRRFSVLGGLTVLSPTTHTLRLEE